MAGRGTMWIRLSKARRRRGEERESHRNAMGRDRQYEAKKGKRVV